MALEVRIDAIKTPHHRLIVCMTVMFSGVVHPGIKVLARARSAPPSRGRTMVQGLN